MVSTACNRRRTCHIDMVLLFPNPECLLWFLATFYLTSQTRSMLRQHHFQRLQVNGAVFEPFPEVYTHNPVFHWKEQIFPKVQHVFTSRSQIRYCLAVCWICLMWSQNYLHFFNIYAYTFIESTTSFLTRISLPYSKTYSFFSPIIYSAVMFSCGRLKAVIF